MSPEALWERVRVCFETDDGSLPTLELSGLTAVEHTALYGMIRQGTRLVSEATFWDEQQGRDRPLDDVANAAELVNAERAAPFHFVIEGATALGIQMPAIGVHVFQNSIAIDYRMGSDWNAASVLAFFTWLSGLLSGSRHGTLTLDESEGPPDPKAFMAAWKQFASA